MLYTNLTRKALQIAYDAHHGQMDKAGLPYIYHPLHLAEHIGDDEVLIAVALLHDTVEDTGISFDDLRAEGITEEVIDALRLLTHDESLPYMDYVQAILGSGNRTAIKVKLADLRHNSNLRRLVIVDNKARARLERYKTAIELLDRNEESEFETKH
jgi:(p)ppGpp synthase/HD superfamily hydrolase